MRPPAIESRTHFLRVDLTAQQYETLHQRVLAQKEKRTVARYVREALGLEQPKTNAQVLAPESTESTELSQSTASTQA